MTHARALLLILLALIATTATAALRAIEEACEVTLSAVTLPSGTDGYVTLRRCERCRPEVFKVTMQTRYVVRPGRTPVALGEMQRQASLVTNRARALVYVYYEPQTRQVRRLVLDAQH